MKRNGRKAKRKEKKKVGEEVHGSGARREGKGMREKKERKKGKKGKGMRENKERKERKERKGREKKKRERKEGRKEMRRGTGTNIEQGVEQDKKGPGILL